MGKPEWAAIAAATATIITALFASLAGLGEHAPGIVAGLLIAAPIVFMYVQREGVFRQEQTEHIAEYKDLVDKLFTQIDTTNASLNSIAINLAAANRNSQIGDKLDGLVKQIQSQEVKANGNAKRGLGQVGGKTG